MDSAVTHYLSLSEVAEVLGISERTAYRWIKAGKLRAYKPGRDYRIPKQAIREAIEGDGPVSESEAMEREADRRAHRLAKTAVSLKATYRDPYSPLKETTYLMRRFDKEVRAYEEIEERQQREATL